MLQKKTEDAAVAAEKKDEKKRKAVENAAKKADALKAAKKPRIKSLLPVTQQLKWRR